MRRNLHRMLNDTQIRSLFSRFQDLDPGTTKVPDKIQANPFRSLISVVLSAQSRDEMTARATRKLFEEADTPLAILALDEERLKVLIKDAGLYNMKARNIRNLCDALIERHGGRVPADRETLMALPGVGRKSADILMRFVYGAPVVAVDTHVHRVCNRLGLAAGKTEARTAASLEHRVPAEFGYGAHVWLLEHGKRICVARRPRCEACFLEDLCEKNAVASKSERRGRTRA
jgi:endonuclease-3